MGGNSGGGGKPGRTGGGGGLPADAGQPGEVVREANKAQSATDVRRELDEMESGKEYAIKNMPGGNVLSKQDIKDMERLNKPERIKSAQERSRERQAAAKREEARNPDKSAFVFPKNPKKGDIAKNGYGAEREWTGTFWR